MATPWVYPSALIFWVTASNSLYQFRNAFSRFGLQHTQEVGRLARPQVVVDTLSTSSLTHGGSVEVSIGFALAERMAVNLAGDDQSLVTSGGFKPDLRAFRRMCCHTPRY